MLAAGLMFGSVGTAAAFSASFSWSGIAACSGPSPAFRISGAPKGTVSLRFAMRDLDAPNFNHGGGTVAYDGKGTVARGAISYIPPCPPGGAKHRYVWTIEALDASGNRLASASASGTFPPR
jgi:phosphatidylethanolamine-binding protein (PEBP) family uncharacterized protein